MKGWSSDPSQHTLARREPKFGEGQPVASCPWREQVDAKWSSLNLAPGYHRLLLGQAHDDLSHRAISRGFPSEVPVVTGTKQPLSNCQGLCAVASAPTLMEGHVSPAESAPSQAHGYHRDRPLMEQAREVLSHREISRGFPSVVPVETGKRQALSNCQRLCAVASAARSKEGHGSPAESAPS
jgi:hypothetical protein